MSATPEGSAPGKDEVTRHAEQSSGFCEQLLSKVLDEFNSKDGDSPCASSPNEEESPRAPLLKTSGDEGLGIVLREVFSAVTMLLPTAASAVLLHEKRSSGEYGCLPCGLVLLAGFAAHMVASLSYHFACALSVYRPGLDVRPWRCLDQSLVFIGCITCAWALSGSTVYALGVVMPFCIWAVVRLWYPCESEMRHHRFQRMGVGILLYLAPLAARGQFWPLGGCCLCMFFTGLFFAFDHHLAGWGHGLMHLVLVPYACIMMYSALELHA